MYDKQTQKSRRDVFSEAVRKGIGALMIFTGAGALVISLCGCGGGSAGLRQDIKESIKDGAKGADKDLIDFTKREMFSIQKRAMRWYRIDTGKQTISSEDLPLLIGKYIDEGTRCVVGGKLVDPWSTRYLVSVDSDGRSRLYSAGPNRRDEKGKGDDVCLR